MKTEILNLIRRVSTTLPDDIREALLQARLQEQGVAELSLDIIEQNIKLAEEKTVPLCQDTGFPTFFVTAPLSPERERIETDILWAVEEATKEGILRPNAVDSLTGKNSGTNMGKGFPKIIWEKSTDDKIRIQLLLKGGGSENVSGQMALPMETDLGKAGRDMEGVIRAVLQIVKNAQGKGCAPGILGVHIGGDRESGYTYAKKNLLLPLFFENPDETLREIETEILTRTNALGIGPMGFGGKTTLLGVKCSASHRLPASFFVTVSYSCWAMRRGAVELSMTNDKLPMTEKREEMSGGVGTGFKPVLEGKNDLSEITGGHDPLLKQGNHEKIKSLTFPCTESQIRALKIGDIVMVHGEIFTGRDTLHSQVVEKGLILPKNVEGSAVYHCGPVATHFETRGHTISRATGGHDPLSENRWKITAAGPTTSIREEAYQAEFIQKTGIKAVIGKGGMGEKTQKALSQHGAVYLHAIGGAAAFYANAIEEVQGVDFLEEFGVPEAMWHLKVKNFLCVVTMEAGENP
ncbi:MAG: FumA C-terminus/TtdB family hydratase beta subunit [Candidatus Peregrinibacteria bacterium]